LAGLAGLVGLARMVASGVPTLLAWLAALAVLEGPADRECVLVQTELS
jgi:hypothetical protein